MKYEFRLVLVLASSVWRKLGSQYAYKAENLQPTFITEPISTEFWGAFSYSYHTPLINLHKRGENKRKSEKHRLGFNSKQYVYEILIPHLLPFYERCGGFNKEVETIEDRASYHTSVYTRQYNFQYRIKKMDWPFHSADLNPIENVWAIF